MKIYFTSRNSRITDDMKDYILDKMNKIEKYSHKNIDAHISLDVQKYRFIAEVTVKTNITSIPCKEEDTDIFVAIDRVVGKLDRQMRKSKEKIQHHKVKSGRQVASSSDSFVDTVVPEGSVSVVPEDVVVKSLVLADAISQLNSHRENFFVFKNPDTGKVNIMCKIDKNFYELLERKDHKTQGEGSLTVIKHELSVIGGESKDDMKIDFTGKDEFMVDFMTAEEAAQNIKSTGVDFLMFFDRDTGKVGVVYQKKCGSFGLVEPQF